MIVLFSHLLKFPQIVDYNRLDIECRTLILSYSLEYILPFSQLHIYVFFRTLKHSPPYNFLQTEQNSRRLGQDRLSFLHMFPHSPNEVYCPKTKNVNILWISFFNFDSNKLIMNLYYLKCINILRTEGTTSSTTIIILKFYKHMFSAHTINQQHYYV